MICSKCKYYAPLIGRSYDLSKCLKFLIFTKPAIEKCKGDYFEVIDSIKLNKLNKSNEVIKK